MWYIIVHIPFGELILSVTAYGATKNHLRPSSVCSRSQMVVEVLERWVSQELLRIKRETEWFTLEKWWHWWTLTFITGKKRPNTTSITLSTNTLLDFSICQSAVMPEGLFFVVFQKKGIFFNHEIPYWNIYFLMVVFITQKWENIQFRWIFKSLSTH